MSRRTLAPVALALAVALALPAVASAAMDRYMVVFKQGQTDEAAMAAVVNSLGGKVVRAMPNIGVAIVTSEEPNFRNYMLGSRQVEGVSADVKYDSDWSARGRQLMEQSLVTYGGPELARMTAQSRLENTSDGAEINDPTHVAFWPFQWNMQILGLADVYAMGMYGDPEVKVALLGAGVDYRHPDLAGRVDLDLSKSFVPSDDALVEQLFPGANPVADLAFHTTHVATQITCNVTYLACVAPNIRLIGVKVQDLNEKGTIGDLASGIVYSADVHADVIAIPFVYWGPGADGGGRIWNWGNAEDRPDIIALRRAIRYAKLKGSVVLAETSTPFFQFGADADADGLDVILPAQAGATVVGASGSQDVWSNISNYGLSLVDIVAPGGWADPDIPPDPVPFSPFSEFVWGACSSFSQFGRLKEECKLENQPQFLVILGAQPAVGHAAAVAALIKSRFGHDLHGFFVNQRLLRTAVDIDDPGIDAHTGHGRVDALRALTLH